MSNKRVNIRYSAKHDRYRVRFYGVTRDQIDIITSAIEEVQRDTRTSSDICALEYLCLAYLDAKNGKPKYIKTE